MNIVLQVCALAALVMLGLSALLTVRRIFYGPNNLDRMIASDVLLAIVIAGIGVHTAWTRSAAALPLLMVLGLVAFVGGVAVARFSAHDRDRDRP